MTVIETSDDKDDSLLCRLSTLLLISVIVKVFLSDLVEAFGVDAGTRQLSHQVRADAKELSRDIHLENLLKLTFLVQVGSVGDRTFTSIEATNQEERIFRSSHID